MACCIYSFFFSLLCYYCSLCIIWLKIHRSSLIGSSLLLLTVTDFERNTVFSSRWYYQFFLSLSLFSTCCFYYYYFDIDSRKFSKVFALCDVMAFMLLWVFILNKKEEKKQHFTAAENYFSRANTWHSIMVNIYEKQSISREWATITKIVGVKAWIFRCFTQHYSIQIKLSWEINCILICVLFLKYICQWNMWLKFQQICKNQVSLQCI